MANPLIDGLLIGNYADGEAGWGASMDANLSRIGWLLQGSVVSAGPSNNTPPGSPATNSRYLIGTAPTGAWAANANNLARWTGAAWEFIAPVAGFTALSLADGVTWAYNGAAWVSLAAAPTTHGATHVSTGADPIPAATGAVGGLMSAADKTKLDLITKRVTQIVYGSLAASVAPPASPAYGNLINLPITVTAGALLLVQFDLSARKTDGGTGTLGARIRVDGTTAAATVAGQGYAATNGGSGASSSIGGSIVLSGVSPGAHNIALDFAAITAGAFITNPPGAPNTDAANLRIIEIV